MEGVGTRGHAWSFRSMWNSFSEPAASLLERRTRLKSESSAGSGRSLADATSWWEGSRSPGQLGLCESVAISHGVLIRSWPGSNYPGRKAMGDGGEYSRLFYE